MVQKIYIARHGFRLNWLTTTWQSKTGLPRDPPLAAFGETQAQELGAYFASLPESERPTAIFSSPYYRCLQTSQPVATALNIPIYVEHGISEWYSPVSPGTGLHPRPGSATSLRQYFPQIDPIWDSLWYPSRRGEDVQEVHERCDGLLATLLPEIERRFPGKHACILLVSHAATIIALARTLLGEREYPLRVGCCSLSEFTRQTAAEGSRWDAQRLADGSHLVEGASREWGFEDIEIAAGKVVDDPGVPGTEFDEDGPVGSQVQIVSNL
ncbi:histidine phosphatase superfamily [Collybia nuda]|uniref:Histidine phosphatase superfamily n=1 Tax=Collybia nuda TaxID=64659 RepID=A0A9P5XS17_9AGAR|nr:histidine phosphatase superfamily [Collybia nuda]KAF9460854.1 histidine phosphatase superfamily [Collybia nuda]